MERLKHLLKYLWNTDRALWNWSFWNVSAKVDISAFILGGVDLVSYLLFTYEIQTPSLAETIIKQDYRVLFSSYWGN